MQNKESLKKPIRRDTLVMCLKNSSEYIELEDILYWLSRYSGVEIKQESKGYISIIHRKVYIGYEYASI